MKDLEEFSIDEIGLMLEGERTTVYVTVQNNKLTFSEGTGTRNTREPTHI